MCGRFTLRTAAQEVARVFRLTGALGELRPRYNIAPSQEVAAVRVDDAGLRQLAYFRWGLVPSWGTDPAIGNRMINARAETVAEKPSYRTAFAARRCLILADGFYEWQKTGTTAKAAKQPYYITMREDGPFAFAGLWERNMRCGAPLETCTIITTDANALMRPLHDRMPVILPFDKQDLWLDPAVQEVERLTPLLVPFDSQAMKSVPVSTLVNNPRNELAECIAPQ
jgi:putative SOS response-associated peptidase YedK